MARERGQPFERLGPRGEPGALLYLPPFDLEEPAGVDAFAEAVLAAWP